MLKVENVKVHRNNKVVLDIDTMEFNLTKRYNIFGDTGVGKTTLFELLAGIEKPLNGDIILDEFSLYTSGFMDLSRLRKKFGVMFDIPGLISNQNIYENLKLALNSKNVIFDRTLKEVIVSDYLSLFKMNDFIDMRPGLLSIDQKRIISFIRAIIANPTFLLFDGFCDFLNGSFLDVKISMLEKLNQNGVGGIFFTKKKNEGKLQYDHFFELKEGFLHEC